jgi:polyhydroxyalkanoate synthesis regulator phasin
MRDLVQKALYLGVGIASYAAEKAGSNLQELKVQAQKLADDLVARGEMTTEEARRYVDDLMREAQGMPSPDPTNSQPREPRRIEIISEEDEDSSAPTAATETAKTEAEIETLRKQVEALQAELRRLGRS